MKQKRQHQLEHNSVSCRPSSFFMLPFSLHGIQKAKAKPHSLIKYLRAITFLSQLAFKIKQFYFGALPGAQKYQAFEKS